MINESDVSEMVLSKIKKSLIAESVVYSIRTVFTDHKNMIEKIQNKD